MKKLLIALSLAFVALLSNAWAEESTTVATASTVVTPSTPEVGTRFYITDGGYFEVIAVDPPNTKTRTRGGRERTWLGGIVGDNFLKQISNEDRRSFTKLQPLSVSESPIISFEEQSLNSVMRHTVHVLRRESIETPAGFFDTFVVEWRTRLITGMTTPPVWINTYWYAPSIHFNVKWTFKGEGSFNNPPSNNEWSLKKVTPPVKVSTVRQKLESLWSLRASGAISAEEFDREVSLLY